MKKATIARFVIGGAAIFAAFGLAACGAETGAPEAEGVGQTSEALTVGTEVDLASLDYDPNTGGTQALVGREFAASCILEDTGHSNRPVILFAGGFNQATPAYFNDSYLYDPVAPSLTTAGNFGTNGTDERAYAKLIRIPGENACLLMGGDKGGAAFTNTFKYTWGSGWSAGPSLAVGRSKFVATVCGSATKKIMVLAGVDNGTRLSSIYKWDLNVAHSFATAGVSLGSARYDVAFAANDSNLDKFVIAGGNFGLSPTKNADLLQTDTSCDNATVASFATKLHDGREGAVAFNDGTANEFYVTAGHNGASLLTNVEKLAVTWTGTPAITDSVVAGATITGTHLPNLVFNGSSPVLIGGDDVAGRTITTVQEYVIGTGWATIANLTTSRVGAVAENLGGTIYAATGLKVVAGTPDVKTDLTKAQPITP